ncbi:MAG: hypothetical protein NVS1B13_08860 [Flavisolibacter sp.]
MKSNKKSRAVTVGVFVAIGITIFIAAILALGGQRKTFANTITVRSVFDDVNGLQSGSNVWFAGVKIGTVKKIQFNEVGKVNVWLNIEEKSKKYIHKDAKAKIGTDGLIGNKIIVLYGGSPEVPEIREGDDISVQKSFGMDDMFNTFQSNNKNLLDITENFKSISRGLAGGKGTMGKLLNDDLIANDIQSTLAILKRASFNAQALTASLSDYANKLNKKGSLTNSLVTDTVIFSRLKSASYKIDEITNTANRIAEKINLATDSFNKGLNSPNSPAGVLLHDKQTADNIKVTLKNLQSSSSKLDQDLEALQHNFLLRGFFRKKAKQNTDSTAH